MSKPTIIVDTAPEAEAVLIQLLRTKSPAKRVEEAISASNRVAEQCKNAIRRMNEGISEDEVRLRFIELNYGPELASNVRAYLADK
ncbi:MAG: hypothetical protein AAFN77_20535 [Planctomycetota bacterium]